MSASSPPLFASFLPYRESLALSRWCRGLLKIKTHLQNQAPLLEHLTDSCGSVARQLHPALRPPSYTPEEFNKTLQEEAHRETLTESQKEEYFQNLGKEIHQKIKNGELDLWEKDKKYTPPKEAERFLQESLDWLGRKILPACNPKASAFESLIQTALTLLQENALSLGPAKGLQRALYLWEEKKIRHEGEPPYRIVFSQQVSDFLGVDGELESIKLQTLRPPSKKEKKLLRAALKTSKKFLPAQKEILQALERSP